jgi:pyrimidine oxygenase
MIRIGVFIPIGSRGWLISTNSPEGVPSFERNKQIVQLAESYGLDFALSMIKMRGFGGPSGYWDYNLESFTLMAGLASVTSRIQLFASVAVLTLPPAICARMAVTIDSIAPGRFGVNIVSGWQPTEYKQMNIWPGEAHFARRYDYCSEYVHVMQELWRDGRSDFKGEFFTMDDCRLLPRPSAPIKMVGAGQSERGMRFVADYLDYNFIGASGINEPANARPVVDRLRAAVAQGRREVGALLLLMVIADETDAAAMARWEHYVAGTDDIALDWMMTQAGADTKAESDSTAGRMNKLRWGRQPTLMLKLIGGYAKVAALLDEIAEIEGIDGIMMTFDDFVVGMRGFGERIQPLMKSRAHVVARLADDRVPEAAA